MLSRIVVVNIGNKQDGFEVLTAVTKESTSTIFWDVTLCSPVKVH
jgi:hypothetical protein